MEDPLGSQGWKVQERKGHKGTGGWTTRYRGAEGFDPLSPNKIMTKAKVSQ